MEPSMINEVTTLVNAVAWPEFRPCAFFDSRLDCIRVIARDCSVYEERINDRVTVLVSNRPGSQGQIVPVGFTIKGARHFCQEHGIPLSSIRVTALLDALVASYPGVVMALFTQHLAKPLVAQENIDHVDTGLTEAFAN